MAENLKDSNPLDVVTGTRPQSETAESVEPESEINETSQAEPGSEEASPEAPEGQGGGETPETKPEETIETKETEETGGEQVVEEKQEPVVSEDYKRLKEDFEKLRVEKEELESLLEEANPLQYFVNEGEYKKQQILKKNPDINPVALDRILSEDIGSMKHEDVLILEFQMENPGADVSEIREYVLDKYNYNPDEGKAPFGMVADANKARKNLSGYASQEAELPKDIKGVLDSKKQAFIDKIEQSRKQFRPDVERTAERMEDIADGGGKDTTSYKYDPEFKKQIPDLLEGYLISEGVSEENIQNKLNGAVKTVQDIYKLRNFEKIVKARVDEAVKAKDDEWRAKVHNPKDPNTQTAPEQPSKDTTFEDAERMLTRW